MMDRPGFQLTHQHGHRVIHCHRPVSRHDCFWNLNWFYAAGKEFLICCCGISFVRQPEHERATFFCGRQDTATVVARNCILAYHAHQRPPTRNICQHFICRHTMRAIFNLRNGITTWHLAISNESEGARRHWFGTAASRLGWRDPIGWVTGCKSSRADNLRISQIRLLPRHVREMPSDYFGTDGWLKTHRGIPRWNSFLKWNVTLIKFLFRTIVIWSDHWQKGIRQTKRIKNTMTKVFENFTNITSLFAVNYLERLFGEFTGPESGCLISNADVLHLQILFFRSVLYCCWNPLNSTFLNNIAYVDALLFGGVDR